MLKNVVRAPLIASLLSSATPAVASTCSCAGVPLLGAMELATPGGNQWFLAGTYEFHDVSELVSGSDTVPNPTGRDRTSEAFVFEASRGFGERWSVSTMVSTVHHERTVGGIHDSASGIGDGIVLLKYTPVTISLYSKNAVSFGIGARVPLGEDSADRNGITLAEDMQPSTGAYGSLAWLYAARALNESRGARIYASTTYADNGSNDRDYRFGNETTVSIGGSYQTQTPWGFNVELAYRHTERDQRGQVTIPNTGGNWLDIIPSAQYHVTETLAIKASAKIPVARDLNDQLQFTTKYALRVSLSYVFGR